MVKVSDVIAEFLKERKIDTIFGIIGSANSHIFDSINKLGYTRIVNTHHEQAAVLAAGGYYRASGKLAAVVVTAGAGSTNAITGAASNWADSIPGVIISGQEPLQYIKNHANLRMYGTQGLNIVEIVKTITKYAISITDPNSIQDELEKAFDITIKGRPGPCWIDVPFNIQSEMIEKRNWNIIPQSSNQEVNVDNIINEINFSQRPVIVGGNGVRLSGSKDIFNTLINILKIPTLLTWSGIDLLDNTNENFYGRFGIYGQRCANFIIQNADLIIVLGSRLALPQVGYDFNQFARGAKIIVVDIDKSEFTKHIVYESIHANCKDVILNLLAKSKSINGHTSNWTNYCKKLKIKYPWVDVEHVDNGCINSYKFIDKLSACLKDNHIIVTDMGTALLSGHQTIKLKPNQTMFTSLGLGEMGYGLPGALGAAMACPDRDILCLNCDGGIMMNLQELHTIIENNIPMKIIIFNNDGYLMIKHTQKMLFNSHYVSVDSNTGIGLPVFNKLMPALGYKYYELKEWDQFDVVNSFLNTPEAAVLEVFMDPQQEFVPKVKGVVLENQTIFSPPIEEMSPLLTLETIEQEMLVDLSSKSRQIKR